MTIACLWCLIFSTLLLSLSSLLLSFFVFYSPLFYFHLLCNSTTPFCSMWDVICCCSRLKKSIVKSGIGTCTSHYTKPTGLVVILAAFFLLFNDYFLWLNIELCIYRIRNRTGLHMELFCDWYDDRINNLQDRQAMLKAKHCLRVAPVTSAGRNKMAPSSEWLFVNSRQLVQAVSL